MADQLAALTALRRALAILTGPGGQREERAASVIRRALDPVRRPPRRTYRGQGSGDHGQLRRAAWVISALREGAMAVDAEAIARGCKVDVRTAYRDLAFLRARGAPILYDRGRREYRLRGAWQLDQIEAPTASRPRRGSR